MIDIFMTPQSDDDYDSEESPKQPNEAKKDSDTSTSPPDSKLDANLTEGDKVSNFELTEGDREQEQLTKNPGNFPQK